MPVVDRLPLAVAVSQFSAKKTSRLSQSDVSLMVTVSMCVSVLRVFVHMHPNIHGLSLSLFVLVLPVD